jgi:hypothetical protein
MKAPPDQVHIRLSIHDHQLVAHTIPPPQSGALATCEIMHIDRLPISVMAWVDVIEAAFKRRKL